MAVLYIDMMKRSKSVDDYIRDAAQWNTELQREYAEYIEAAIRGDTKQRRLEKILPMIIAGNGLNDRYR